MNERRRTFREYQEHIDTLRAFAALHFKDSYLADPVTLSPVEGSHQRRPFDPVTCKAVAAIDALERFVEEAAR